MKQLETAQRQYKRKLETAQRKTKQDAIKKTTITWLLNDMDTVSRIWSQLKMKMSVYLPYSCRVPDSSASVWRPAALETIQSQDAEAEGGKALAREWLRWMEWRSPSMGWNHKDLLTILGHLDRSWDKPFNRFTNYAILCLQIFTFSITQILFSASNHHVRVQIIAGINWK